MIRRPQLARFAVRILSLVSALVLLILCCQNSYLQSYHGNVAERQVFETALQKRNHHLSLYAADEQIDSRQLPTNAHINQTERTVAPYAGKRSICNGTSNPNNVFPRYHISLYQPVFSQ